MHSGSRYSVPSHPGSPTPKLSPYPSEVGVQDGKWDTLISQTPHTGPSQLQSLPNPIAVHAWEPCPHQMSQEQEGLWGELRGERFLKGVARGGGS